MTARTLQPNAERIGARIDALAGITDPKLPPYTRRAFTDSFEAARGWLAHELRRAGLMPAVDAGGNLSGRREGTEPGAPALLVGSHIDTVMGGGRFDGVAGVVAGLEVAQVLAEAGRALRHPLEVVDFLSEEASDYGASCIGSRALGGTLSADMLASANPAGETLAEGIRRMGGDPARLGQGPLRGPGDIGAYLELHIEQGPRLEREGRPIGVVSGIVAIRRYLVTVTGQADHAGTTPMPQRRDALVGAAELVRRAHALALAEWERVGLVATVGRLEVFPNSPNVVPAEVRFTLEARNLDPGRVTAFFDRLLGEGGEVLAAAGLRVDTRLLSDAAPAPCSPLVMDAFRRACAARGHEFLELQSGAGHDGMQLAPHWPFGMIFVPSRQGRSHASEEFTTVEQLAVGTEVLLEAVLLLDEELGKT